MPIPSRASSPLGATTTQRKWALDVDTNNSVTNPNWVGVYGITDFQPTGQPTLQDDSDYDSQGYKSQTATAQEWGATATLKRAATKASPNQYDPGQEFLRLKSAGMGDANSAHIRYYELNPGNGPKTEAYEGYVAVQYQNNGGAMDALSSAALTLTGQGYRQPITHPDNGSTLAPVISSFSPSTAAVAGGTLVTITGSNLDTVTGLTVDGTTVNATDWSPAGFNKLVLKAPAKAAGQRPVIVTGPGGPSVAVNLTYA